LGEGIDVTNGFMEGSVAFHPVDLVNLETFLVEEDVKDFV